MGELSASGHEFIASARSVGSAVVEGDEGEEGEEPDDADGEDEAAD